MADELVATTFEVDAPQDGRAWGWLGLVASGRGLRLLVLPKADVERVHRIILGQFPNSRLQPEDPTLLRVAEQVRAYLHGERQVFEVESDRRGYSNFELSVWSITCTIPYGETRTYGWIAGQLGGGAGTAQAVGAALASNPLPLIVPCHRVVGADGGLHGFSGGLDLKARLLALETRQLSLPL